jgi:hypothetical protein
MDANVLYSALFGGNVASSTIPNLVLDGMAGRKRRLERDDKHSTNQNLHRRGVQQLHSRQTWTRCP